MRVGVSQRQVRMLVGMRRGIFRSFVPVLMMFIVVVLMIVRQVFMRMLVPVLFSQYQPCREYHEQQSKCKNDGKGLVEQQD